jgi:disulfide bond formation protein DsbB
MRRYEQVSGALFALIAIGQLTRSILRLPAQVGTLSIPIWCSVVAFLVTGSLAVWAFRTSRRPI